MAEKPYLGNEFDNSEVEQIQRIVRHTVGYGVPEVSTDAVDYNGVTPDYYLPWSGVPKQDADATTTSTSYATVFNLRSVVDVSGIPDGMVLYGRFMTKAKNDTSNETTTVRPRLGQTELTELDVSVTDTSKQLADSGWQEITSNIGSGVLDDSAILAKVTAGTGTVDHIDTQLYLAGVSV